MRAAERGARNAGPGLEVRATEVTLGRDEAHSRRRARRSRRASRQSRAMRLTCPNRASITMGPPAVGRGPRRRGPCRGAARKISRLTSADGSSSRRGILRHGAAQRRRQCRVDGDQVGLLAGLERADRVRRGRAPAPRRASRGGASRAAPSAGAPARRRPPAAPLRERPRPHHAEERQLRAARHVRPEPDRQCPPRASGTAASRPRR